MEYDAKLLSSIANSKHTLKQNKNLHIISPQVENTFITDFVFLKTVIRFTLCSLKPQNEKLLLSLVENL